MKAKIKSKPIQQQNSIKSNIAYPNLKKKKKKMYRCWFRQSDGGRFSFSMCLQFRLSKSSEGMDGGLYLCCKFFFFLLLYLCIACFFFFFSIFVLQFLFFGVLQAFAMYFKRLVFFLLKKL